MPEARFTIEPATRPDDVAAVKALFRAYAEWLGVDLCFQGFDEEMADFPSTYDVLLLGQVHRIGEVVAGVETRVHQRLQVRDGDGLHGAAVPIGVDRQHRDCREGQGSQCDPRMGSQSSETCSPTTPAWTVPSHNTLYVSDCR